MTIVHIQGIDKCGLLFKATVFFDHPVDTVITSAFIAHTGHLDSWVIYSYLGGEYTAITGVLCGRVVLLKSTSDMNLGEDIESTSQSTINLSSLLPTVFFYMKN